ncbi:MAG: hypothetical protein DWQ45_17255 [Planctomycetota bacterium]|nr:MAG: hypothetical protein DWQ41_13610 [Planctomycetota bacterium]REK32426.1 MAG: hypothetical protein DWQ45_17255 [Planctomycetota bacterium]
MAQQLRKDGVNCHEFNVGCTNQVRMASTSLEVIHSRRIDLYDDRPLMRDLMRLNISMKSYGYRLEVSRNGGRHADRAIVFMIAPVRAVELASKLPVDLSRWLPMLEDDRPGWQPTGPDPMDAWEVRIANLRGGRRPLSAWCVSPHAPPHFNRLSLFSSPR